jgi:two-component system osmolarity sensor histidine kinase EnvZ
MAVYEEKIIAIAARLHVVSCGTQRLHLTHIDDDGPSNPASRREEVFKPFVWSDQARDVDEGGSALGHSIARNAVRTQSGDVMLADSPMGDLRTTVRIPV